jgi:hypothetical protein
MSIHRPRTKDGTHTLGSPRTSHRSKETAKVAATGAAAEIGRDRRDRRPGWQLMQMETDQTALISVQPERGLPCGWSELNGVWARAGVRAACGIDAMRSMLCDYDAMRSGGGRCVVMRPHHRFIMHLLHCYMRVYVRVYARVYVRVCGLRCGLLCGLRCGLRCGLMRGIMYGPAEVTCDAKVSA